MNRSIRKLFDLREDQDDPEAIDANVRAGVRFAGTNLWVLIFAILVASVGLNVNSTAVVIGAMLISPLMGPIVGLGYGAAVKDFNLIRQSARNLGIFTGLSLLTSTVYFMLSPLDVPGSELMARTTPTLWDVLIATFGGAAGMVALTRRSISNVVPGVAIATALMPPLCTAGFGLANARWEMFAGAFYLFLINCVFIAASTLAVAKLVRLPAVADVDPLVRARHRVVITVGLLVVLVPSVWLAWRFVQQEVFAANAQALLRGVEADERFGVVGHDIDRARRRISVTVVGAEGEQRLREQAPMLLAEHGLKGAELLVRRAGGSDVDVGRLREQLQADVRRDLTQLLSERLARSEEQRAELQAELQNLSRSAQAAEAIAPAVLDEMRAQQPAVQAVTLAEGRRVGATATPAAASTPAATEPAVVVVIEVTRPLSAADRERLAAWLAVRLGRGPVDLIERVVPPSR
ncbi:DUF389 domain-containing protein [Tepidimonas sp.]|uniref:DUF389 domain-containing protein n=1 Tax=Tepidimonas sp. TaxID=2002775 RepID=UPI0028CD9582|nr:DUF389 domain-containing protein [Tepidimonas sp.]MDT7928490.1 DUF389 domain-containing protein [Tepidimonas sp.]